jgi:hypothetical protein
LAIALATADDQITATEAEEIRQRWEELKSVTEGFVAACEAGDFRALREGAVAKRKATRQQS